MPGKAITDPDLRQASPSQIASQMGWAWPSGRGRSWQSLVDIAERLYYENRKAAT